MNRQIKRLATIAAKPSRLIVGLMSGTSLDGLDVALVKISGSGLQSKVVLQEFITWPYPRPLKERISRVFAKPRVDFHALCELHPAIGLLHGQLVLKALQRWRISPARVDCIASHGQTVFHAPRFLVKGSKLNATLQIGDGDHVAVTTGILTLSDFRQKHIAAGGEGAPLAVYGDYLLFAKKGENRILLNAGGIGNFTFLPSSARASEVFVTDTGPANTLLDQLIHHHDSRLYFDRDARLARQGQIHAGLLKALKSNSFFRRPFPKTIGPELFNVAYVREAQARAAVPELSLADTLATLTRFSAETMADAIRKVVHGRSGFTVYTSGGGAHNPLLMQWIQELLPGLAFRPMQVLGIPGDAKEAVLFAVLANETLAGGFTNFGSRSKVPSVTMGKISFPD